MTEFSMCFKFIIVGSVSTGKSSIMVRFTQNEFDENSQNTVGVEFGSKIVELEDGTHVKLQIWDTAGQERYRSLTRGYYRNSVGTLIVYDVTKRDSFNNIISWLDEARERASPWCLYMLIGNKIDLEDQREVSTDEGIAFAKEHNMKFIETSAKSDSNITDAFMQLTSAIYKISSDDSQPGSTETSTLTIPLDNYSTHNNSCPC